MRPALALSAFVTVLAAAPASAQLSDRLSRGNVPNALDRAVAQPLPDNRTQATLDQQRSEQAARDAQARLGPPPTSTLNDGPAGVQGIGSGSGTAASPTPTTPQN